MVQIYERYTCVECWANGCGCEYRYHGGAKAAAEAATKHGWEKHLGRYVCPFHAKDVELRMMDAGYRKAAESAELPERRSDANL